MRRDVRERYTGTTLGVVWLPQSDERAPAVPVLCEACYCRPFEIRGNYRVGIRFLSPEIEDPAYLERFRQLLEDVPLEAD